MIAAITGADRIGNHVRGKSGLAQPAHTLIDTHMAFDATDHERGNIHSTHLIPEMRVLRTCHLHLFDYFEKGKLTFYFIYRRTEPLWILLSYNHRKPVHLKRQRQTCYIMNDSIELRNRLTKLFLHIDNYQTGICRAQRCGM